MRAGAVRLKLRSESGDGKELGFWLEGNALGTSMLLAAHVLFCSCSGWNVLMWGDGEGVCAFVREVHAGGEVCCLVPGPVPCIVEVKRCLERTLQRESWLSVSRFGEGGDILGGLQSSPISRLSGEREQPRWTLPPSIELSATLL